jgi:hypothetical protein
MTIRPGRISAVRHSSSTRVILHESAINMMETLSYFFTSSMQHDRPPSQSEPSPKLIIYVYEGERKIGPVRDSHHVGDFSS